MDLSNMAPEEKDQLLSKMAEMHPEMFQDQDSDDDSQWKEAICKVVEILIDKVELLEVNTEQLRKMVEDDLFGGIKQLYDGNVRSKGIEDLKGQYGDLFAPHMDALKEMSPDEDVFEKMHDLLSEMKKGEGYTDEMGDNAIKSSAQAIADMIAKVKGEKDGESKPEGDQAIVEEGKPEGGAVEVTKVSAEPVEEGPTMPDGASRKFVERLKKEKARNQAKGL